MKRGFTLVELLVVISIISLLSSIVLSSVTQAKIKAQNSAINSQIIQYINAIELYRSDHGLLPDNDPVNGNGNTFTACLGKYNLVGSGKCGYSPNGNFSNILRNDILDSKLDDYISEMPPISKTLIKTDDAYPNSVWLGATYQLNFPPLTPKAFITWVLQGSGQSCGQGTSSTAGFGPHCTAGGHCTACKVDIPAS